jgi:hypothetical protein
MKKLFLILLAIPTLCFSQTEYIEVSTKGIFGRSEMVVYNDNSNYNDLEYLYIGRNNDNYHWVEYTGVNNVIVLMNDNEGDVREVCIKHGEGEDKADECEVLDAFGTQYEYKAKEQTFQIWISKININ